jgi:quercetin dioxygenase-like cupin family protein
MTNRTSDGDSLRYGDGLARILFSRARNGDGPGVVEIVMPEGSAPPLHAHDEEERIFLLEGRVTYFVGDERIEAGPHTKLVLPAGVPHTYRVEDAGRARWLVVTDSPRFERFVRAVSRPATEDAPKHPSVTDAVAFTVAAAQNGIEILGPAGAVPADGNGARSKATSRRSLRSRLLPDLSLAPAAA